MNQAELTISLQTDGVAVVTGAASGIGQAVAVALAQQGADVACVGRSAESCAETVALVEALGRKALAVGCDVESRAEVDARGVHGLRFECACGIECTALGTRAPGRCDHPEP